MFGKADASTIYAAYQFEEQSRSAVEPVVRGY
jgi:hypothetical protein